MARPINRLSARSVAAATAPGYYADGGGLYLQVSRTGTKSWVFRFTLRGRAREMGLGGIGAVNLASARESAAGARKQLAQGIDPIEARRRTQAAGETFGAMAEAYIAANRAGWRSAKHADQWRNTLATHAGALSAMPVAEVDTAAVVRVLTPIWATKTETATRLRQRIETVLDFAAVANERRGENPARWRGHLDKLLPRPTRVAKVAHHAALPYADLPAFMADLRNRPGTSARALEFLILTAARTGEVVGAKSGEIDLDAATWTVPGERMKSGRPHVVPLPARAVDIVRDLLRLGEAHVFTYRGRALSNGALLMLLERMGRGDITVHGFRSTFRDWVAECTHHPAEVAEMALAHVIHDKTEAAYRRGALLEKRRALMRDWADYAASFTDLIHS